MSIRRLYLTTFIIISMFLAMVALGSCKPDSDLGEYNVPNTYTTYKDENGLYSISYPSDWWTVASRGSKTSLDYFKVQSDSLYEYWNHRDTSKIPYSKDGWGSWSLFRAGKKNTNSNTMSLGVYVLLDGEGTKEQFYNRALETTNYKAYLRETLRIAGREVAIFSLPNRSVVSAVIFNQTCWVTGCGVLDSQDEKDSQIIVRSLRVLK
jgi:hypothetical protein